MVIVYKQADVKSDSIP